MNTTATHDWNYERNAKQSDHADRISDDINDVLSQEGLTEKDVSGMLLDWITQSTPETGLVEMPQKLNSLIKSFPGNAQRLKASIEDAVVTAWSVWDDGQTAPKNADNILWEEVVVPILEERIEDEFYTAE